MTLAVGSRLGPYEILAPLGAGGMGEVYRARDAKLDRDVAVKVLPSALAEDPEALSRFEREAKAVAALSHPNILAIFEFQKVEGVTYAVMELLEGETLRSRLVAGCAPDAQGRRVRRSDRAGPRGGAREGHRASGPEAGERVRDGRRSREDPRLRSGETGPRRPPGQDTRSPTMTRHTEPGTVMGTVGYMSPEQVRGKPADHLSDIFSFGAVLYEMATGRRAFQRDTGAETMTAILKEEPPEFSESGREGPAGPRADRRALSREEPAGALPVRARHRLRPPGALLGDDADRAAPGDAGPALEMEARRGRRHTGRVLGAPPLARQSRIRKGLSGVSPAHVPARRRRRARASRPTGSP